MHGDAIAGARLDWPDAARGMAIALVVLYHAVLLSGNFAQAAPEWVAFSEVLRTMRMPLFFFIAGLFAGKWLAATWRRLLGDKLLLLGWVYFIWVFIRWGFYNLIPGEDAESGGLGQLALHIVWPLGGWFLLALASFFVIAKATKRLHPLVQFALAAAASILWFFSSALHTGNLCYDGIPRFYVFFLAGVLWRRQLVPMAERLPLLAGIGVVALWIVVASSPRIVDIDLPAHNWLIRVAGLGAGIVLATWLRRVRVLRSLGRRTLPIYMSSSLIMLAAAWLLGKWPWLAQDPAYPYLQPLLLFAIALPASFALGMRAPAMGLGWLFAPPSWLSRRFERTTGRFFDGKGRQGA